MAVPVLSAPPAPPTNSSVSGVHSAPLALENDRAAPEKTKRRLYIDAVLLLQVLLSAASLLLVVAGVTKLRSPHPATRAARALSIPATPAAVRVLAGAEVALGIGALVVDAALVRISVGALYAAFLGFVLLALWRNAPISSCGCFGADDTPPSLGHVAINAAGAAVAFVAAADDAEAPIDALTNSVGDAAVLVAGTALVTLAAGALLSGWRMPRALRG